jgi:uncharacterized repeat protein (TIGR01451 family)
LPATARVRARRLVTAVVAAFAVAVFLAVSPLPAETVEPTGASSLTVRLLTRGAAGGPFAFELAGGASSVVRSGGAATEAEESAVGVVGLAGELVAGDYTLQQDLAQLPAEPSGGHWEFTGVECEGAPATVDAPTATATITLDAGVAATCIVTETWVADAEPSAEEAAAAESTTTATVPDDPAALAADPTDVIALAGPTNATIRVFKSGLRTGPSAEGPLAGATFAVYGSEANAISGTSPLTTCVTTILGQCTMDVSVVPVSGTRDVWVREVTAPAGYFRIDTISTGTASSTSDNTTSRPYMEKLTIRNNQTYNLPPDQPLSSGGAEARAFANGLNNPEAPPQCGLNLAMIFDVSSSINASEMTSMKNAARTFVNDLTGTPSQIAMFSFGTVAPGAGAPANLPLTQVATGNGPVMNYINGLPANPSTGSNRTNWDAGLFQVAQSASSYDIALMLTDGNPTVWGPTGVRAPDVPGGAAVVAAGIEEAVASANAVKNEGTQILAIGIGPTNLPVDNLTAISGPGDAFTTGFDTLADLLRELATELCQGTVTIVKETRAAGETVFTPAGGWTFNTSTPTVSPASGTTAPLTGAVNFNVDFSASQAPQTVSFEEVLKPGWNLVPQDGQNARCTTQALTVPRGSPNVGPTGFTVTLGPTDIVSCLVRNEQPSLPRLTLVKQVTNDNGGTELPTAWTLTAAGPATITGATGTPAVTNQIVAAGTYNLSESGPGLPQYLAGPWSCTGATGFTATSVTLGPTDVATCTIVNNDQPARLTLVKEVVNNFGNAQPTDWTLNATGPTPISGETGSTAVTNAAVNAGNYTIFESDGPTGYVSGAWSCETNSRTLFRTAEELTLSLGEAATCTITNVDASAQLTLVKQVVNDDGGNQPPTAWTLTADGPEILSGATGSADVTSVQVPTGTYGLSETGPPGYAASEWVCTGAAVSTPASVTLVLGESATCTIVNDDIPAVLTLSKAVINDNGGTATAGEWTLNAAGPTTGITGATGTAPVTAVEVFPGTYTLSETGPGPPGYTASAWSCTGAAVSDGTSVTPALGETVICAIVNDDVPAELTLVKELITDNGGTALPTDWILSAQGAGGSGISGETGSGSVTNVGVPPGSYALSETGPPGYLASEWTCVGGTQTGASIAVALGESATCTIVNDDIAPQLTLLKDVVNDDGGTAVDTDWTLTATGPTPGVTGVEGDAEITNAPVLAGVYALSESGPTGYAASGWVCTGAAVSDATSVTLAPGEAATCTITNDDAPAQLTLVKVVTNDNGGTAVATDWTLSAAGPTPLSGTTGVSAAVSAGIYALSESGPAGYAASGWVCTGAAVSDATSVTLALGEAATCTITNDDIAPRLTLLKDVVNDNGGAAVDTDWTLTATGPTPGVSGVEGDASITNAAVAAGLYTLSETGPAGYSTTGWVCTGATTFTTTSVTLAPGDAATCTITNDDIPAQLTLVKVVVNDNGGTAPATDWTLEADGPTPVSGTTGVTSQVDAGDYDLSETGPDGYTASGWVCTGVATFTATSVTLAPGEAATCTITNDDIPAQLTLVKEVVTDNGGTALPTDWTLTAAGPTPISGATGTPAVTAAAVAAGTYALSETGPANYAASAWVCTGGTQTGASIALALGESATCTITNDDIPAQLTLIKEVVNSFGGTAVATDWTLNADGPTSISGVTGTADVTNAPVDAGAYTIFESDGPTGYASGSWRCTTSLRAVFRTPIDLVLSLGESATCIVINHDSPAQLTLVKEVVNDNGGTAAPTDWTLTADGGEPSGEIITGETGSPDVTDVDVPAGTYALSESGGPAEYAASGWVCVGATQADAASVTLALGESATCTITNDDVQPELTLVKSTSVTQIVPGSTVPYSFAVTNVSAATANDIVVTDPLPVGLSFVSSPSGCTADAAQVVTCTTPTLAPGAAVTFDIVTQAADPFPATAIDPTGSVPNTATVTAPETNCEAEAPAAAAAPPTELFVVLQATSADCESTVALPVMPTIAITKTSAATAVVPGSDVPYVITVTNTGSVVARNVVVTDDLPVGLTFVSSVPPCAAAGQIVSCPLGDLAPGATATIDLVTRAADPFPIESLVNGEIVNVAIVSGTDSNCATGSTDPVCTDNWPLPTDGRTAVAGAGGDLPFTGATMPLLLVLAVGAIAFGTVLLSTRRLRVARARVTRASTRSAR